MVTTAVTTLQSKMARRRKEDDNHRQKKRCKIKAAATVVAVLVPINQSAVMIDGHDDKQKFFSAITARVDQSGTNHKAKTGNSEGH